MTPHAALISELYLVCTNAETAAAVFRAAHAGSPVPFGRLEDHRTQVLGDLLHAIESVEPGLGQRIHAAMDPMRRGEPSPPLPAETAPPQARKTSGQVLAEISALLALKPTLPPRSNFGDDNHAAVDAQVHVLQTGMNVDQVNARYGDDKSPAFDHHVLDHALHACAWLTTGIEAPSRDWLPRCKR